MQDNIISPLNKIINNKTITLVIAFLVFLFPIIPGYEVGFWDGKPLTSPLDIFWWILAIGGLIMTYNYDLNFKKRLLNILFFAYGLKLIIIIGLCFIPRHGLIASYYSGDSPDNNQIERSVEYPNMRNGTRIEKNINFSNESYSLFSNNFHLWFFNDYRRFNEGIGGDQHVLPFRLELKGNLYVPKTHSTFLYLSTDNSARLDLDDKTLISIAGNKQPTEQGVYLEKINKGSHDIAINYSHSKGEIKELRLSSVDDWMYGKTAISSKYFFTKPINQIQWILDRFLEILNWITIFLIIFFLYKILSAWIKNVIKNNKLSVEDSLFIIFLVFIGYVTIKVIKLMTFPDFNFLHAGNDDLTYATFAQQMFLDKDYLMTQLQSNSSYYYTILYGYILLLGNWLLGESLFPLILLQAVFLGFSGLVTFYLTKIIFNRNDVALLAYFLMLFFPINIQYTWALFPNGTFFIILPVYFLVLLITKRTQFTKLPLFIIGLTIGFAILDRPNVILLFPLFLIFIIGIFWQYRIKKLLFLLGIYFIGFVISTFPFGIRNYYIADQFTILPSATTINIAIGNQMLVDDNTKESIAKLPSSREIMDKYPLNIMRTKFIDYFIENPKKMSLHLLNKQLQFMGLSNYPHSSDYLPNVFFLWITALLGFLIFIYKQKIKNIKNESTIIMAILFAVLMAIDLPIIITFVRTRFMLPYFPILLVSSSYFAVSVIEFMQNLFLKEKNINIEKNNNIIFIFLLFLYFIFLNINLLIIIYIFLFSYIFPFFRIHAKSKNRLE